MENATMEEHLRRLGESRTFARSHSQLRLLRFLLDNAGTEDAPLKETYIGVAFYGRSPEYDPREDSIVRVSVNRLRVKLAEHYAQDGADDPVRFVLPRGAYDVRIDPGTTPPLPEPQDESLPDIHAAAARPHTQPRSRHLITAAAVLGLFLIGFFVWRYVTNARRPWFLTASLEASPVTPGIESEFDPAISPDSKTLAYISRRPGTVHYQIFLRPRAATSESPRVLETGPGDALHPAWSPDGKTLAFLHCATGKCAFQTVPASGGSPTTLKDLPRFNVVTDQLFYEYRQMWPTWAPNGKAVIFPYRGVDDDEERLLLHDLATGAETKLTGGDLYDEDGAPAVSPDGRTVAFRRCKLSYSELWTVDLATHQQKRILTPFGLYWSGLTWARDGSGLLTSKQNSEGKWELWWAPLSGTPQKLSVAQNMPITPVVSPDNASLFIVSANRASSLTLLDTSDEPAVPQLNEAAAIGDSSVEFSPDEKRAAILSTSTGRSEVWLADVDGKTLTNRRQLTHGLGETPMSLSWSPDGSMIAVGFPTTRGVVKIVDTESGSIHDIPVPGLEKSLLFSPVFTPDGKYLFVAASSDNDSGVFRLGIGPIPRVDYVLVHRPYDIAFDGAHTLYLDLRNASGIEKVDLSEWIPQTGALARSSSKPVPQLSNILALKSWIVRNGNIYYLDLNDDERRLRRMNLATGEMAPISGRLPRVSFFRGALAYSPSRRLLIYSQLKYESGAQIMALAK